MSNPYEDPICSPKRERKYQRAICKKRLRGICVYCGSFKAITKDHIQPKSRGGKNHPENLQPLCSYCNCMKGNKTETELKVIFSDIKKNGIWYEWEKQYSNWIDWLELVCEERKHKCPLLSYF